MTAPRNTVLLGDVVERLRELPDNSIDAIVTDPPYGLEFMGKEWDRPWAVSPTQSVGFAGRDDLTLPSFGDNRNANCRTCGGRQRGAKRCSCATPNWDRSPNSDGQEFQRWNEAWAREALRVLKPGGYLLAFGGTRTYHRLVSGLEDAGFEIRDTIAWLYGSGFPKSKNIGGGFGTALKPAHEPIVVARKPLTGTVAANVLAWGTGALNIDGCRVGFASEADERESKDKNRHGDFDSKPTNHGIYSPDNRTGAEKGNYDPTGRWPANVVLDEEAGAILDEQSGVRSAGNHPAKRAGLGSVRTLPSTSQGTEGERRPTEAGGASRFFYCAKASRADREAGLPAADGRANDHPTVKPNALMRWLVRLVGGQPGSLILDPFAGSGSTLRAIRDEGHDFLGIERDRHYYRLACLRAGLPDPGEDEEGVALAA